MVDNTICCVSVVRCEKCGKWKVDRASSWNIRWGIPKDVRCECGGCDDAD